MDTVSDKKYRRQKHLLIFRLTTGKEKVFSRPKRKGVQNIKMYFEVVGEKMWTKLTKHKNLSCSVVDKH